MHRCNSKGIGQQSDATQMRGRPQTLDVAAQKLLPLLLRLLGQDTTRPCCPHPRKALSLLLPLPPTLLPPSLHTISHLPATAASTPATSRHKPAATPKHSPPLRAFPPLLPRGEGAGDHKLSAGEFFGAALSSNIKSPTGGDATGGFGVALEDVALAVTVIPTSPSGAPSTAPESPGVVPPWMVGLSEDGAPPVDDERVCCCCWRCSCCGEGLGGDSAMFMAARMMEVASARLPEGVDRRDGGGGGGADC